MSLLWDAAICLSRHSLNLSRRESKYLEADLHLALHHPHYPPTPISTTTTTAPGQDRAASLAAAVIVSTLLQGSSQSLELAAESALDSNEDDVVFWKSLE